jgi:hypothetical protein
MKKLLLIFLLLSCISTLSYSQSKTEFGVATEGSWFTPRPYSEHSDQNRNGWGAGMGVYASRTIFWRFSADIGLAYRYKQMQQYYEIYLAFLLATTAKRFTTRIIKRFPF